MRTKPRLTQNQHAELGRVLAGIRDELQTRHVQLEGAYPRSGPESLPARRIAEALNALEDARNALDSTLFREHPDTAIPQTYYPNPQDRATVALASGE